MRWQDFTLYHEEVTGTDELGNTITEPVEYALRTGRFTPWTAEDVAIEGREVTENSRKVITPAELSVFRAARKVERDGSTYDIIQVKDLGKFRVLYLKEYRAWQNSDISS